MTKRKYAPKRGDIIYTDFDPAAGHEQRLKRPALVLSPDLFNSKIELALVAPITSRVRGHGFEVILDEALKIQGAVLCHQIKMIDYQARGIKYIEKAPDSILDNVLAKVKLLVN
jgi:mRNA interferase MazF